MRYVMKKPFFLMLLILSIALHATIPALSANAENESTEDDVLKLIGHIGFDGWVVDVEKGLSYVGICDRIVLVQFPPHYDLSEAYNRTIWPELTVRESREEIVRRMDATDDTDVYFVFEPEERAKVSPEKYEEYLSDPLIVDDAKESSTFSGHILEVRSDYIVADYHGEPMRLYHSDRQMQYESLDYFDDCVTQHEKFSVILSYEEIDGKCYLLNGIGGWG